MFLLDDTGILYYGTSYMNSQLDLGKKTADKNISQGRRFVKEFDRTPGKRNSNRGTGPDLHCASNAY